MTHSLMFWKQLPTLLTPRAAIAQDLDFGEEVEGLIDLPIREVINRLRAEFPQAEERPGLLVCRTAADAFEASWTWQVVKVHYSELSDEGHRKLLSIAREFGCEVYEA